MATLPTRLAVFAIGMLACAALLARDPVLQVDADADADNQTSARMADADVQEERLKRAASLLQAGKTDEAIAFLDRIIADSRGSPGAERRRLYAARTPAEGLLYMMQAAKDGEDAILVDRVYAHAWYLKGYALIELGHVDQAADALDAALRMSPRNAHYLSERGHLFQIQKDWQAMLGSYRQAEAAAGISPPEFHDSDLARALRGQGYALIELQQLDQAQAVFERSLTLEPENRIARNELEYIRRLRDAAPR